MQNFAVVLFDLGSTLIYFDESWSEILPQFNQALMDSLQESGFNLRNSGFIERYEQRIQAYYAERETEFLEYTTARVVRETLEELGFFDVPDTRIRSSVAAMYAVSQTHWRLEEDAIPTLEALRRGGYQLGLISNGGDDQDIQTLVDNAGLRGYFQVILTSAAQGIRKPNPRIFQTALDALGGVTPEKAAMVGDTLGADILGARNAGLYSIWITRRADTAANRAHLDTIHPDRTVENLSELLTIFPTTR